MLMKIQPYKILKKKTLIKKDHCHIERHKVEFPNGKKGLWYIRKREDAVIVLPILEDGRVLLQRSYKHGSGQVVVECVAGLVDPEEMKQVAARRELNEETGYDTSELEHVGTVYADPTGSNMKYHFYIARNCVEVGDQKLDEAEQIEVFTVANVKTAKQYLSNRDILTSSSTRAMISYV